MKLSKIIQTVANYPTVSNYYIIQIIQFSIYCNFDYLIHQKQIESFLWNYLSIQASYPFSIYLNTLFVPLPFFIIFLI